MNALHRIDERIVELINKGPQYDVKGRREDLQEIELLAEAYRKLSSNFIYQYAPNQTTTPWCGVCTGDTTSSSITTDVTWKP